MKRHWMVAVAVAATMLLWSAVPAEAAGELDTSFSSDGKVITDFFGNNDDILNDMALQRDGKIVVAGSWGGGAVRKNIAVLRYNSTGSIDTSFGSGGRVMTDFDGDDDVANAVVVQPDDKILVAGWARIGNRTSDVVLVRYLPNGSLDTSFGGDGRVSTNLGATDQALDLALQRNGSIVVSGWTDVYGGDADFAILRYFPNGTPDTSFSGDGRVTTGLGADDFADAVAIHPDGKIIAVGMRSEDDEDDCFGCNDWDLAFARYNPNGSLDTTFDGDGKKTEGHGGDEYLEDVFARSDGRIFVAGRSADRFMVSLYRSNGSLDESWGQYGRRWINASFRGAARGLAIQTDGKIVLGGDAGGDLGVARITAGGSDDTTFSGDGHARTNFGGTEYAAAMVRQPDGKIIVAGYRYRSDDDRDFVLARYRP